jgi:phage FluMu protein Com
VTGRFNVDGFLRADIKTRFEVYELGVAKSGILTVEDARRIEGLDAGNVETAPVPQALPSSIPTIPVARAAEEVRCTERFAVRGMMRNCGYLFGRIAAPYELKCPRCKSMVTAA